MTFEIQAQSRPAQGTGASRRLRKAGTLPGIVYGGAKAPLAISLDHNSMYYTLQDEAFHTALIKLTVDGAASEQVLVRAVQYHPYKQQVLHIDFQRVAADEKIHVKVPLHFIGGDDSPAVKLGGCIVSAVINDIDVVCLPGNLPEFIKVDLSALDAGHSVHVSELTLPAGVELVVRGEGDAVVATALKVRGAAADTEDEGEEA